MNIGNSRRRATIVQRQHVGHDHDGVGFVDVAGFGGGEDRLELLESGRDLCRDFGGNRRH